MHPSSNGGQHPTKKVQKNRNNYASVECGAKILAANPEAKVIITSEWFIFLVKVTCPRCFSEPVAEIGLEFRTLWLKANNNFSFHTEIQNYFNIT